MKPVVSIHHVPHEGLGTIAAALDRAKLPRREVPLYESVPAALDPEEYSALIVMGGPMNVDQTDRCPWLVDEIDWIRAAIAAGKPVLGVCLGSQLIAAALGARVYAGQTKEIGFDDVALAAEAATDRLFGGIESPIRVLQWHGCTFDLPQGAVRLALSPLFANQAFRYGETVYALQFHVEVSGEMISDWLDEPENRQELAALDYVDAEAIRANIATETPAVLRIGEVILDRFCAICREACAD